MAVHSRLLRSLEKIGWFLIIVLFNLQFMPLTCTTAAILLHAPSEITFTIYHCLELSPSPSCHLRSFMVPLICKHFFFYIITFCLSLHFTVSQLFWKILFPQHTHTMSNWHCYKETLPEETCWINTMDRISVVSGCKIKLIDWWILLMEGWIDSSWTDGCSHIHLFTVHSWGNSHYQVVQFDSDNDFEPWIISAKLCLALN